MIRTHLLPALLFLPALSIAQDAWFGTYTDADAYMADAHIVKEAFVSDIKRLRPESTLDLHLLHHTSPALIYIQRDTVHLSMWHEVSPDFKELFAQLGGGEEHAQNIFGHFFNGFYLPHELGHGFQFSVEARDEQNMFDVEYFANTIAMLWWRKQERTAELDKCYRYAKKMMDGYPDPFPPGVDQRSYFSDNYAALQENAELFAAIYPYVQFRQFIAIYEDRSLPDFDTFVRDYLAQRR